MTNASMNIISTETSRLESGFESVSSAAINHINSVGASTKNRIDSGILSAQSVFKDPVSCITHLISAIAAVMFAPILFVRARLSGSSASDMAALGVFVLSMILLYSASASYHGFKLTGRASMVLKRLDHMMIFVLIAGTYTPICVCAMREQGMRLLILVWALAVVGMIFKLCWVTCPKWISSVIYIAMGWVVVFAMPKLIPAVSAQTLAWLYAGGIIYTIGGIIYALKLIRFNSVHQLWGSHEIFHLFVMAGTICHFISICNIFN